MFDKNMHKESESGGTGVGVTRYIYQFTLDLESWEMKGFQEGIFVSVKYEMWTFIENESDWILQRLEWITINWYTYKICFFFLL